MKIVLSAALLAMSVTAAASTPDTDPAMLEVAKHSGCITCHAIESSTAKGKEKPIGPAWQDVARKYHGVPGAESKLTATVMLGSSPYQSHWKDKVSGLAMPPNAVAIDRPNARRLVKWILALPMPKAER